ncbi:MAG TPA: Gfo/Idh/MocA family oxidoreductase [Opitutus sp.]|nr:Gfo/Idh/MocA family oxidoreductase [Opitutus sp.]
MSANSHLPRIALIGISGYGRIHLQLARECRDRGEAAIVAATVINPQEEAENVAELRARGCAIYGDHEEMLRAWGGRIDLCMIPTGINWHARMTIAALRAGANVLVEKPLAGSLADGMAMRAAERESGRFVAVGFQDLYEPGTLWLKEQLRTGAIGGLQSVRFLGVWPRDRSYFTRNDWAGRTEVNGVPVLDSPLNNAFGHFVMLSQYFASPERHAAAAAELDKVELWRAHDIPSFDTAVVAAHTPQGVNLWFGVSHACRETIEPEIAIQGSAGTAFWRYENESCVVAADGGRQCRPMPDTGETRRTMMAAVLRRLRDESVAICGVDLAVQHTRLIETLHRFAPVNEFPPEAVKWAGGPAGALPEVTGLAPALRRAFEQRSTLAGAGFALALRAPVR